jgi:uncharacterized protein with GYD domain
MDDDEVNAIKLSVEINSGGFVEPALQVGVCGFEALKRLLAGIGQEVRDAPAVFGLVDAHVMTTRQQLARDSTEKMGIAMIPV